MSNWGMPSRIRISENLPGQSRQIKPYEGAARRDVALAFFQLSGLSAAPAYEAIGERRARRSGSNDDEIDRALVHGG
jgi:hypothetical protein